MIYFTYKKKKHKLKQLWNIIFYLILIANIMLYYGEIVRRQAIQVFILYAQKISGKIPKKLVIKLASGKDRWWGQETGKGHRFFILCPFVPFEFWTMQMCYLLKILINILLINKRIRIEIRLIAWAQIYVFNLLGMCCPSAWPIQILPTIGPSSGTAFLWSLSWSP